MANGYLARFGEQLVRNGYAVIPIVAGTKRPPGWMSHKNGDPWSAVTPSLERVRSWVHDKRLVGAGVGVNLGRGLLAVDIDVRDEAVAAEMLEWCEWNLPGNPPQRIGFKPKTLLLFRTESPMRKITSAEYLDGSLDEGGKPRKARVECLADGEQFVAYAIHPDTGKPYEWPGDDLIEVKAADLPIITPAQAQAVTAAFERIAEGHGWQKAPKLGGSIAGAAGETDPDDWTATIDHGAATNLTIEELRRAVFTIPNDDLSGSEADYDTWLQVGMAVFHQTEGGQDGLDIWCEWSNQASKHVQSECERKWRSFDITDKNRRPLTARWLLKVARSLRDEKVTVQIEDLRKALDAAATEDALRTVAKQAKSIEMDRPEREMVATLLQRRMKAVLGTSIPVGVIRDMIRFEKAIDKPKWLDHWCYIGTEAVFYNRVSQVALKTEAFDSTFARNLLTDMERREGKAVPEKRPSDMALNVYQVRVVDRRLYLPTVAPSATETAVDGQSFVNTYTRTSIPEVPTVLTEQNLADLARVKAHCEWLIPDERERWLSLSWMAHIVKTNGRSRWALVFLGVEGSGKTFFFEMLGHVLGRQNVRAVGPKEIEKEFNGWVEGVQLVVFEEIKQHGHNRYDVLNSLKPIITNDHVSVRRMRTDSYMVPNTASIMAYTNFADALPVNDGDRRYMLVATAPTKADVQARGPTYFADLFDAAARSAGAVRGWLMEMEPHPEFDPNGRAPMTAWKQRALELTERDEVSLIRSAIEETGGTVPGLSRTLLSTKVLTDYLQEKGEAVPLTHTLNRALMDIGLTFIGRVKIDGDRQRVWADDPARWSDRTGAPLTNAIREWLDPPF